MVGRMTPPLSITLIVMFGYLVLNKSITFEQLAHGARSVSKLIVPVADVLSPNWAAMLFNILASESTARFSSCGGVLAVGTTELGKVSGTSPARKATRREREQYENEPR